MKKLLSTTKMLFVVFISLLTQFSYSQSLVNSHLEQKTAQQVKLERVSNPFLASKISMPAPANDLIGNATLIDNCGTAFSTSNYSATNTGNCKGDPQGGGFYNDLDCNGATGNGNGGDVPYSAENDIWYKFCPTATGSYTLSLAASGCDIVLAANPEFQCSVFQGVTTNLGTVVSTGTGNNGGTLNLVINVTSTVNCIFIEIDGYAGIQCNFAVSLSVNPVCSITSPLSVALTNQNICAGSSATLTALTSGGTPAYTYTWAPGTGLSSTNTQSTVANPTITTNYTVTVRDNSAPTVKTTSAVVTVSVNSIPTVTANASNSVICNGQSVTLTGSGTAASYTWTGGVTDGAAFSPTVTNTYTVTGISAAGCTNTAQQTVSVTANPTVAVTNATTCAGTPVTFTASGATTFSWSTGATTSTISTATAGVYTVTGTTNNCTNTKTVSLTVTANPTVAVTNATTCAGTPVTFTATGATTFSWSTGATTSTISAATAGVYTVTGTTNNCTNTKTVSLTVTANPTVAVTNATTCAGTPVTFTATGATTFSWSTGATTSTISTATAGVYTVTGTTNNCTDTKTVGLTVTANPTVAVTNATTCAGTPVTFTATGATTFSWSTGATTSTISTATAGIYTVTGTTNNCTNTKTVSLTVTANPTVAVTNATTCAGTPVTYTATGATTFSWSTGATTSTISTATAGVYTVTGTTSGCTNTKTVSLTVTANPTVAVTNATTCAGTPVTFTATGATTFSWSTGATTSTISTATAGIYTVTGTTNNCTNTKTVSLTVTANPTLAVTNTTICNGNSVVLTASGALTYSWNTSATTNTISVNPTSLTVYTVTGTTSGCTDTKTVSVTVNSLPTTTASTSGTISCSTPTINLNSTLSGVNYTWSAPSGGVLGTPNSQNTTASGAPGTYTLYTQNASGCTFSTTTAVTQNTTAPSGFSAGAGQTMVCSSSSVALTGIVGTPANATLNWAGANVCGTASTIATAACGAGVYTLTATNPTNGCIQTSTVLVSPSAGAPAVTVTSASQTITCSNTVAVISVSTSAAPVSYTWTGTGIVGTTTLSSISVSQGGTFQYTVENTGNGCSTSNNIIVSQNTSVPTTTASTSGIITCANPSVTLQANLSSMNYTWTAPAGGFISAVNSETTLASGIIGTYSLTILNPINNCVFNTTTTVTENITQPVTTATVNGVVTCVNNTVTIGTPLSGMNYTWTAPLGGSVSSNTNQVAIATGIGNYSLMVIDPTNGCSYTTSVTVTNDLTPPTGLSAGTNQTLTCSSPSVILTGTLSAPGNATILWTGSNVCTTATDFTVGVCGAGDYTVTATNPANGCTSSATVTVSPNPGSPTVSISSNAITVDCNNSVQTVTVTSNPNSNVTYTWNNAPASLSANGSIASFTALATTDTFVCTVTDNISSCTETVSVIVTTNTTIPTTNINVSGVLNCTLTSVDLSGPSAAFGCTWTASTGTVSNTSTVSVTQPDTYTVTVEDPSNGCVFTTSAVVNQNITLPIISAGNNATLTCSNPIATLNGNVTSPTNPNVLWTGPNVCGTQTTVISSACSAGDYTLTVNDPSNGCSTASVVTISPNAGSPIVSISATTVTIDCNNAIQTVTVTGSPTNDVTYSWNNAPTTLSTDGTVASFTASATNDTFICTVTNTNSSCTETVSVLVITNTVVPVITISPTQSITCANSTADILTTVTPIGTSYTYNWLGTGVNGQTTNSVTVSAADNYSVEVTNAVNGCSAIATSSIVPDSNLPSATINATSTNTVITCNNNLVNLNVSVTPTGSYSYTWSTGSNSSTTSVNVGGTHSVTVLNTVTGCPAVASIFINSNTTQPTVVATNTAISCGTQSVNVVATSTNNVSYNWSTVNGTILTNGLSTIQVGSTGNYVVTVQDAVNGCVNTATAIVTQNVFDATISANPLEGIAPLPVTFSSISTSTASFSWSFADGNSSTLQNPTNTYTNSGVYTATLVATDLSGACLPVTKTITIVVNADLLIEIPNVFTPNGDGSNDVFKIKSTAVKTMEVDVFNRWGTKLFSSTDINFSWDGSGTSDGTYFYIVKVEGNNGTKIEKQGSINIYR